MFEKLSFETFSTHYIFFGKLLRMSDIQFKMNNGLTVPAIGLGTWKSRSSEVYNAVIAAIEAG